ncbi:bis(5'-nucleosyl)-tetraphosphatase (symmetrical) YqeK [Tepidanaerobacter syntrophicus]|uniref:bis(5'-nucleosyl)-tetraphosphatase (symmetrical) n=1 Tax=Tepidanaerobacter syntrophicus TaxID=224999 RepID=A0A0U9HQ44_9FIRM|nr:bis(5'-nucleosyl)-tetraphosphatase (symmetrical) YqeK [Tepidanaerobacter syntrophicus]GAQ26001.1 HD superfamily hydrolase of NAD metabolism [Tepidanaerobacter syntrophicus]GLI19677.1 hydrolase [Tepidanaerobacter syntrophicus]
MIISLDEMIKKLKVNLGEKRFLHSIGVMETAEKLALRYGANVNKAKIAGLLHDCARGMSEELQLKLAQDFGILLDDIEIREKVLIHGPLGAELAKRDYGIYDEQILHAIKIHTTGDENMDILDKVIFIADFIEPSRCFPDVEKLRRVAFQDLDDTMVKAFDSTIRYVLTKRSLLHPKTISGRNFILIKRESEFKQ